MRILQGDSRIRLKEFPDNNFDSCVCDPPYELGFMGKRWDSSGISYSVEMWREVWRVLKPGAHLLAFGGARTYHRIACAIEDAGFQIRDQISWIFGSGFPKSLNVSKGIQDLSLQVLMQDVHHLIDKDASSHGCSHCHACDAPLPSEAGDGQGVEPLSGDAQGHNRLSVPSPYILPDSAHKYTASFSGLSGHLSKQDSQGRKDAAAWQLILDVSSFLCPVCFSQLISLGSGYEAEQGGTDWSKINALPVVSVWAKSEKFFRMTRISPEPYNHYNTEGEYWQGFGTALKPAAEYICVARKPLEGTVVANVLKYGTGAINVAGCRIETEDNRDRIGGGTKGNGGCYGESKTYDSITEPAGRWPANVIHDGSDEVLAEFEKYGERPVSGAAKLRGGNYNQAGSPGGMFNGLSGGNPANWPNDNGSAARFFYCAKASQEERNRGLETRKASQRDESRKEGKPGGDNPRNRGVIPKRNNHPTVKPLTLMAYLVRLVTPPGGVVLDPFMGSGSTLIAAAKEGFDAVGIDLEAENIEIAERRCRGHLGMLAEVACG
jgi:DNA modification methylase